MSAHVVNLKAFKLKQAAIRKGERVRRIAEELAAVSPEYRDEVGDSYVQMGWAQADEIRLALKELETA